MANDEHLAVLMKGAAAWNEWRSDNNGIHPDLSTADLSERDLSGYNLQVTYMFWTSLRNANLAGACLRGSQIILAWLEGADLSGADLRQAYVFSGTFHAANLSHARLDNAYFAETNLDLANLHRAELYDTTFAKVTLRQATLEEAKMGGTVLADVDLSETKGLASVIHTRPSTIGFDTLYRSVQVLPESFISGVGLPLDLLAFVRNRKG
jgi:uncharacterized protein YjbI with pentapeptide repeats